MDVSIEGAQVELADRLMSRPGVVGVGVSESEGAPCLKVYLAVTTDELTAEIPTSFRGYPVVVEESEEIRAPRPPE